MNSEELQKVHKAHYALMNIECDQETLNDLDHAFKFSDAILRHLTIKTKGPVTEASPMMRQEERVSLASPIISDTNVEDSESDDLPDEPAVAV